MSSTVTTATVAVVSAAAQDTGLASVLGLVTLLATLLVLLCLEVVRPSRGLGARRLGRGGVIAAAPLLSAFFLTLALKVGH